MGRNSSLPFSEDSRREDWETYSIVTIRRVDEHRVGKIKKRCLDDKQRADSARSEAQEGSDDSMRMKRMKKGEEEKRRKRKKVMILSLIFFSTHLDPVGTTPYFPGTLLFCCNDDEWKAFLERARNALHLSLCPLPFFLSFQRQRVKPGHTIMTKRRYFLSVRAMLSTICSLSRRRKDGRKTGKTPIHARGERAAGQTDEDFEDDNGEEEEEKEEEKEEEDVTGMQAASINSCHNSQT